MQNAFRKGEKIFRTHTALVSETGFSAQLLGFFLQAWLEFISKRLFGGS
jgi:hypothetical protein